MKKTLGITAVAAFMLLAAYGTVEAWPRSGGGITGIDRLRPGSYSSGVRQLRSVQAQPFQAGVTQNAQSDTGTSRSFSFEPGDSATTESNVSNGTACCVPQPTCCTAVPSCANPAPVAPETDVAPPPPSEESAARSYSFEPEAAPAAVVYRAPSRRSVNRAQDRMFRRLHPGSSWRR